MKPTKSMSKMWIIMMIIMSTLMMMPLQVAGASENAPTISFAQRGGEILKQSDSFKNDLNPNGYGVVPVMAKAATGRNIKVIYYVWDYTIDKTQKTVSVTWPVNKPERSYEIQVPQTSGLHVLQVQVLDDQGGYTDWISVPYFIVDKLSGKTDEEKGKPTIDSASMPQSSSTLELNSKITVNASDPEAGIYYIGYAWRKTGTGNPSGVDYTRIYQRESIEVDVNPPATTEADKTGSWTLFVFAGNSTPTSVENSYVMSDAYVFNYEIVNGETVKALDSVKTEVQELIEGNYTSNSWASLNVALNLPENTQTQLETKITAIQNAKTNLVDISSLRTDINNAKATYTADKKDDYSETSWNFLQTQIQAAEVILANANATKTQVDGAKLGLAEAIKGLTTDKSGLQTSIENAEKILEQSGNYTEASITAIRNALTNARTVNNNANAKQSEINSAKTKLDAAINAKIDIKLLKDKIAEATAAQYKEADYNPTYWRAYTEALANANTAKNATTQGEVDTALENLSTAMTNLAANKKAEQANVKLVFEPATIAVGKTITVKRGNGVGSVTFTSGNVQYATITQTEEQKSKGEATITALKAKEVEIIATFDGDDNTKPVTVKEKLTIEKGTPSFEKPTLQATVGQTIAQANIAKQLEGTRFTLDADRNNMNESVGTVNSPAKVYLIYTPTDSELDDYKIVKDIEVTLSVSQAVGSLTGDDFTLSKNDYTYADNIAETIKNTVSVTAKPEFAEITSDKITIKYYPVLSKDETTGKLTLGNVLVNSENQYVTPSQAGEYVIKIDVVATENYAAQTDIEMSGLLVVQKAKYSVNLDKLTFESKTVTYDKDATSYAIDPIVATDGALDGIHVEYIYKDAQGNVTTPTTAGVYTAIAEFSIEPNGKLDTNYDGVTEETSTKQATLIVEDYIEKTNLTDNLDELKVKEFNSEEEFEKAIKIYGTWASSGEKVEVTEEAEVIASVLKVDSTTNKTTFLVSYIDGNDNVITKRVTVTVKPSYTVTFVSLGKTVGTAKVTAQNEYKLLESDIPTPTRQGYSLVGWFIDVFENLEFDINEPISGDITVTAKWESNQKYAINATVDSTKGTISIRDANGNPITEAVVGTEVTITVTPQEGYALVDGGLVASYKTTVGGQEANVNLPINKVSDNVYSFEMPSGEVTVEATFVKTGHTTTLVPAKEATCTEAGNKAYYTCADCDKLFEDEEATIETTLEEVTIPATGHDYDYANGTWTWADDASTAKYVVVCTHDVNHKVETDATITSAATAPTCEADGFTTYTAKATVNGEEKTSTKVITAEGTATGHDYEETSVTLNADKTTATVVLTCKNDNSHVVTIEDATATAGDRTEADCENDGVQNYSVTYAHPVSGSEVTTSTTETLEATGHDLTHHEAKAPTCTAEGNVEYWSCSVCNKNFSNAEGTQEIENVVIPRLHTVIFMDGDTQLKQLGVAPNGTIAETDLPDTTKAGYEFKGWYTTSDFQEGTEFNVEDAIVDNTTLYAKYRKFLDTPDFNWVNHKIKCGEALPTIVPTLADKELSKLDLGSYELNYYIGEGKDLEKDLIDVKDIDLNKAGTYTIRMVINEDNANFTAVGPFAIAKLIIEKLPQPVPQVELTPAKIAVGEEATLKIDKSNLENEAFKPTIEVNVAEEDARKVDIDTTNIEANGTVIIRGKEEGTVTITVTYRGDDAHETTSKDVTLSVAAANKLGATDFTVTSDPFTFDGIEKQAQIESIVPSDKYIVTYESQDGTIVNPRNVGTYTVVVSVPEEVTIEGIKYEKVERLEVGTLTINKKTLDTQDFEWKNTKTYYGESFEIPVILSTVTGVTLEQDEYIVYYYAKGDSIDGDVIENPTKAGEYTVRIKIKAGNSYFTESGPFAIGNLTIEKKDRQVPNVTIQNSKNEEINKVLVTEKAIVKFDEQDEDGIDLVLGQNVTITTESDTITIDPITGEITPVKPGYAEITVTYTETESRKASSTTVQLSVVASESDVTVDDFKVNKSEYAYTGVAPKADEIVKSEVKGYTVKYYDESGKEVTPINAGKYSIKVTGEGYDIPLGTLTIKPIKADSIHFYWQNNKKTYTGKALTLDNIIPKFNASNKVEDLGTVTTFYYKYNADGKTTESTGRTEAIEVGKYKVRIQIAGDNKNFTKSGPFAIGDLIITQATLEFAKPTGMSGEVGKTLASVTIPDIAEGKLEWKNKETILETAGIHSYTAIFTPNDANYATTDVQLSVNVVDAADDVAPVIHIPDTYLVNGEYVHVVEANKDAQYQVMQDAYATDNIIAPENMKITHTGTVDMGIPTDYAVYYHTTDGKNEAEPVKVIVRVVDTTAPTLRFADDTTGTKSIILEYGKTYERPEMIAWDNSSIVNIKLVDDESTYPGSNAEAGEYFMKYYAVDGSGKSSAVLTVKITVNPKVKLPSIMYKDGRGEAFFKPDQVLYKDVTLVCEEGAEVYQILYKASKDDDFAEIPFKTTLTDNGYYHVIVIKNGARNEVTFSIQK